MNRKDAQRAAHAVIDHLAAAERPHGAIEDPQAWRKAVRNRIRTQRWDTLVDALGDDHGKAVAALIKLIAPEAAPTANGPEAMSHARTAEFVRNDRRLRGLPPLCARCDDAGVWFDDSGMGHQCDCATKGARA